MVRKLNVGVGMTPCESALGSFIRTCRIEQNLTQVLLAELCGLTQGQISQLEIGNPKHIDHDILKKLAIALQCDAEELYKHLPVKPGMRPITELEKLIRSRREELDMTIEKFAKEMNMNIKQAIRLEIRKRSTIRYKIMHLLANVLNLDPSNISKFVGPTRKKTTSEFGNLVRTRRKELLLSLVMLAAKMGVSRQFINQIEFGQARLIRNDEMVARLANVLDIDLVKLKELRQERRLRRTSSSEGLGLFLATKRRELKLNQAQFAKYAGISTVVMSGIESGSYLARKWVLAKIVKAIGCEIPRELVPPPHVRKNNTTR